MLRPVILHFDSLPSTNTEAVGQALRGAPEGLCITAWQQTEGRGRQQRKWVSPPGAGLYFSIVLRPCLELRSWPLLTLMSALAVHDALRKVYKLYADIKWPNDILVNDRKLAGILAETVETVTGRAAIVGIGINLSKGRLPLHLQAHATSIEEAVGEAEAVTATRRGALLRGLTGSISNRYAELQSPHGAERTLCEWAARSSYTEGKSVRVALATETFTGITRGLESDGALRVETQSGAIKVVRAGDVTALRVMDVE